MNSRAKMYKEKIITAWQQPVKPYLLNSDNRFNRLLQYGAFAAILFGIKLSLILHYGNATPFWDQWDGEAMNLYKPYLSGTLKFSDLLTPHNEHRIFTTRILALELLQVNKVWNPLLQMIVNASLHVFMIIIAVLLLSKVTGRKYVPALLFFSLVLFALPFGWENILSGFQAQFYFVLLFSVISLWNLIMHPPFSLIWFIGILCAVLAFFSLSSGVFVPGAAAVISLIIYFTAPHKTYRQLLAVVLLAALFILEIVFTPTIPFHAIYKASSIDQFYYSLTSVFGWPVSQKLPGALICNIPVLIFVISLIRKRLPANDPKWFLAALVVWSVAQCISIAYGRATFNRSPRYLDVFSIGLLVNFVCLLVLAQSHTGKQHIGSFAGALLWTTVILISLGKLAGTMLPDELAIKHNTGVLQETNTRNYLKTGDIRYLKNKGDFEIPFPDPDRLASILAVPEIRQILPANINNRPVTGKLDGVTNFTLTNYYVFIMLGLTILVLSIIGSILSQSKTAPYP